MKAVFLLGSESDKEFASKITDELGKWEVPFELIVASAHKVPEKVLDVVNSYNNSGEEVVFVTLAGRSNGLSGVTAASCVYPVIACPPYQDKDDFMVNINSTLQMPSDTPVLTILDPKNCALAVARIFAVSNAELREKIADRIKEIKNSFN